MTIRFIVEEGYMDIDTVNSAGETALQCAAVHKACTSALQELLSLGGNPDVGAGAFQYACHWQNWKGALILLQSGLRNFGHNTAPTHRAVAPRGHFVRVDEQEDPEIWECEREEFLREIVSRKWGYGRFDIDEEDAGGRSPLMKAVSYPASIRTLRLLVELGANVNHPDRWGVSPIGQLLSLADYDSTASIIFLLRHGARLDLPADTTTSWRQNKVAGSCALDTAFLVTGGNINHPVLYTIFQHASIGNFSENFLSEFAAKLHLRERYRDCRTLVLNRIPGARLDVNREWLLKWLHRSVWLRDLSKICFYLDRFPNDLTIQNAMTMVLQTYDRRSHEGIGHDLLYMENEIINTLSMRPDFGTGTEKHGYSSLLHLACKYHHPDVATQLLGLGSQVNILDEDFHTPLFYAVRNCCSRTVKLLLKYGANPWDRPSDEARRNPSLPRRQEIIDGGWRDPICDHSPFQYALSKRSVEMDRHFARTYCDIEPGDASLIDIFVKHCGLPPLPEDRGSLTYIHDALKYPDALRVLLEAGADPDAGRVRERPTPLVYAVQDMNWSCSEEMLESIGLLVSHGADVYARSFSRGMSFLNIVEESRRIVANDWIQVRASAHGHGWFDIQYALTRLFEITVDPNSGTSRIEMRSVRGGWSHS